MFKAHIDPYLLVGNAAILSISDTVSANYTYTLKDGVGNTIFSGIASGVTVQINVSDMLKSLVSAPDPATILGTEVFKEVAGFVASFSIVITNGTDTLTLNPKAVMGGIPKSMFRDLAKNNKTIFSDRLLNPSVNFLLTTRTRLSEVILKETELFPLMFLPCFTTLQIKSGSNVITTFNGTGAFVSTAFQVDLANLRTNYFNSNNQLINRFDFYADDVYAFSVNISESTSYDARTILFRNSFGAYEKIEITGVVKYQPEVSTDTDYLRYDAINDSFTNERERPEADEKYTAEIGYDLPARKLWCRDLLGSDDCYLINNDKWYRSKVTGDKPDLESSQPIADSLQITIELADKESCYTDESVEQIIATSGNYSIPTTSNPISNEPTTSSVQYLDCGTDNWNNLAEAANFFTFLDTPTSGNRPSGLPVPASGTTIQYRGIRFGINSPNFFDYGVWLLIGNNTMYKVRSYIATEIGSGQNFTGSIDATGHLILTFDNGTQKDVGLVVGAQGPKGDPGERGADGAAGQQGEPGVAGTDGVAGKSAYQIALDNGFVGTEAQWLESLKGANGISIPVNLTLFKQGATGAVYPQIFKWITNLKVTTIELTSNCSEISVTIAGTTYNHTTLVGVSLPAGTEMIINDITIVAGKNNANAIIIFQQI